MSTGSESDIKPVPWCRKNQDRLRPRNIIDSSTSSDPAECDSDDLHAKQPNLPVACKEKVVVCEPVASPQPSTSRGNSDASADRKKHTALKTLVKERQGRRKVAWDEEINDDTQPDGGFTSISDVLGELGDIKCSNISGVVVFSTNFLLMFYEEFYVNFI